MSTATKIEWTDVTWNPIRGCSRVSDGCRNCYAERQASRFSGPGQPYEGLVRIANGHPQWTGKVKLIEEHLGDPLKWRKPRRVFVNSMSDLFHEALDFTDIDKIFGVMAASGEHTFQILTKRPQRMLDYIRSLGSRELAIDRLSGCGVNDDFCCRVANAINGVLGNGYNVGWPMRNVWLGVSVEDQQTADERIPILLQVPAAVRWISAEPLLGAIDLRSYITHWACVHCDERHYESTLDLEEQVCKCGKGEGRWKVNNGGPNGLHWVVVGGESGPDARSMHPDWPLSLRDQCVTAHVPFFFKQWGEYEPVEVLRLRSGPTQVGPHIEWPDGTKMVRVGKKAAGRLLDGLEWNEYPEARA